MKIGLKLVVRILNKSNFLINVRTKSFLNFKVKIIYIGFFLERVRASLPIGDYHQKQMKIIFGKTKLVNRIYSLLVFLSSQFGDLNPNSIESSYYERTINATYFYGANHIDGEHHIYSLFYGISNTPTSAQRKMIISLFFHVIFVHICARDFRSHHGSSK